MLGNYTLELRVWLPVTHKYRKKDPPEGYEWFVPQKCWSHFGAPLATNDKASPVAQGEDIRLLKVAYVFLSDLK